MRAGFGFFRVKLSIARNLERGLLVALLALACVAGTSMAQTPGAPSQGGKSRAPAKAQTPAKPRPSQSSRPSQKPGPGQSPQRRPPPRSNRRPPRRPRLRRRARP